MNRRRFIWQKAQAQSGLPEGYTAVDYLQSSGTQWINTEITPSQDTKVIIKFMANGWGYESLIGGRATVSSNDQFTTYFDAASGGRFLFRMDGMSSAITYTGFRLDTIYTAELSGTKMEFMLEDGTISFTSGITISDFSSTVPMLLFKAQNINGTGLYGKVYFCKIYHQDNLVRDFQPCLDTGGVPCMFDFVSRKSFYNVNTGSFTWG
ncbi:MAG: hypothetical protein MSA66_07870 [Oscillospiraceae bacterium]|nr:hypothetical protein [Oscillospiraceae bacterium]